MQYCHILRNASRASVLYLFMIYIDQSATVKKATNHQNTDKNRQKLTKNRQKIEESSKKQTHIK